jgi:endonuclease YncB( thermonuclease family)
VYLADLLVRRGYARVGGLRTELPDDRRDQPAYMAELKALDDKARQTKSGIWSMAANIPGVSKSKGR